MHAFKYARVAYPCCWPLQNQKESFFQFSSTLLCAVRGRETTLTSCFPPGCQAPDLPSCTVDEQLGMRSPTLSGVGSMNAGGEKGKKLKLLVDDYVEVQSLAESRATSRADARFGWGRPSIGSDVKEDVLCLRLCSAPGGVRLRPCLYRLRPCLHRLRPCLRSPSRV